MNMFDVVFVDGPAAGRILEWPEAPATCTVALPPRDLFRAPPDNSPILCRTVQYNRVPWSFDDGPTYAYVLDDPDAWDGPPAPYVPSYPPER